MRDKDWDLKIEDGIKLVEFCIEKQMKINKSFNPPHVVVLIQYQALTINVTNTCNLLQPDFLDIASILKDKNGE